MNLNEGSNYYCPLQHQQQVEKMIIKTEASDEDDQFMESEEEDFLLLNSSKLKCEDEQNEDVACGEAPVPIKQEPEGSSTSALKEEIGIEDHKPGWELLTVLTGSRGSVGIVKDRCESVQESETLQALSSESKSGGELKYNCSSTHCAYKTNHRPNFIRHYNCVHSKNAEMNKCQECSFETKYKNHFTEHYKIKHSKEVYYNCQECSFRTKWNNYLTQHCKYKHSKDGKVYRCEECSYKTKITSNLTSHYEWKHSKDAENHLNHR